MEKKEPAEKAARGIHTPSQSAYCGPYPGDRVAQQVISPPDKPPQLTRHSAAQPTRGAMARPGSSMQPGKHLRESEACRVGFTAFW